MKPEIKNCLILQYTKLNKMIKEKVKDLNGFHNDCLLRLSKFSEFTAKDLREGIKCIEDYYEEQKQNNGFKGTFKEFVSDYNLELEVWILKNDFDLTNIDEILIEVCW